MHAWLREMRKEAEEKRKRMGHDKAFYYFLNFLLQTDLLQTSFFRQSPLLLKKKKTLVCTMYVTSRVH